ncbi:hypothetical protein H9P43_002526 [Blastocladiella emersonii ATCC 22665]|nr:hypothetical protein H9P43_002526 [Blastocladiella emersonii ATCC 22665]
MIMAETMSSCLLTSDFTDSIAGGDKMLDERTCSARCRQVYADTLKSDPGKCTVANSGRRGAYLEFRANILPLNCAKRDGQNAYPRVEDALKVGDPNNTLLTENPAAIDKRFLCTPWMETICGVWDAKRPRYLEMVQRFPDDFAASDLPNTTVIRGICGFSQGRAASGAMAAVGGGSVVVAVAAVLAAMFALTV